MTWVRKLLSTATAAAVVVAGVAAATPRLPSPGCFLAADPLGDEDRVGHASAPPPVNEATTARTSAAGVDLTGVAVRTTRDDLHFVLRVANLEDKPADANGDSFLVQLMSLKGPDGSPMRDAADRSTAQSVAVGAWRYPGEAGKAWGAAAAAAGPVVEDVTDNGGARLLAPVPPAPARPAAVPTTSPDPVPWGRRPAPGPVDLADQTNVATATYLRVGNVMHYDAAVGATYDQANDAVVLSARRADIARGMLGGALPDGASFTVQVSTRRMYAPPVRAALTERGGDTLAAGTYVVGDNACFPAPPATLALTVPARRVQHGDPVELSATLRDAAGAPVERAPLVFAVGGRQATAATGASGAATVTVPAPDAGRHEVEVSFAGDGEAGPARAAAPLDVVAETTVLKAAVTRRGDQRVVSVTLTDDDQAPLAGRAVTWFVDGRRAGTAATDRAGRARRTVAAGAAVRVTYGGQPSRYLPAQLTLRAR